MDNKKVELLKKHRLLNGKPECVCHPLFVDSEFFDPLDLVQVRYEMIRAARSGEMSVTNACRTFGFSRDSFYKQESAFMKRGFVGLLGSPRGRRPVIALNQEVLNFITRRKFQEPNVSGEKLRIEVHKNFGVECSKRTVERVIRRLGLDSKKKWDSP